MSGVSSREWLKEGILDEWTMAGRPQVHPDSWTNNGGENFNLQVRVTHFKNKLNYRIIPLFKAGMDSFFYLEGGSRCGPWTLCMRWDPDLAERGRVDEAVAIFPSSNGDPYRHLIDLRGFECRHQKQNSEGWFVDDPQAPMRGVWCKHMYAIGHLGVASSVYDNLVHRIMVTDPDKGRVIALDTEPFEKDPPLCFTVTGDSCSCGWARASLGRAFGFMHCPYVTKSKDPERG